MRPSYSWSWGVQSDDVVWFPSALSLVPLIPFAKIGYLPWRTWDRHLVETALRGRTEIRSSSW